MAWLFHAVEDDAGTWTCRHGLTVYDTHDSMDEALQHVTGIAQDRRPSAVFVHPNDGAAWSSTEFGAE